MDRHVATAGGRVRPCALAIGGLWGLAGAAVAQPAQPTAPDAPSSPTAQTVLIIGVSPLPGLGIPKDRVPANVQTAGSDDIERSHAPDLSSFMNRFLGSVHVNEIQNNPFQPDVSFRGYTASPLLGTQQGLSVYMDGVRMNQPFGDVVSWDLIPKSAIGSIALMPGSNPLFGLNTLGGALSVQTKNGIRNPGTSLEGVLGQNGRASLSFDSGGHDDAGRHWFITGSGFKDDGWRTDSPSEVLQVFGKFGRKSGDTDLALTASAARTDLNGNGLQEQRFLQRDYASVYTKPDNTRNDAGLLNLALTQALSDRTSFSGNAYFRRIRTTTYNADVNDDSLEQALYQPNAVERAALAAAGYTGFPTAGASPANTAFPKWRCIAQALLQDEPAETCNGVINQTATTQSNYGLAGQFTIDGTAFGLPALWVAGAALDISRTRFRQGSELGYLNPDRSVTGVGAYGDGVSGGEADGEPYDTRVDLSGRTRTWSIYASGMLPLAPTLRLTLSGRYNRTTLRNRDAILPGGGPGSLDTDQTFARFNPAIGLTFAPNASWTAYAGMNQGTRAPSSVELGCADPANPCKLPNAFAGDPPLRQVVTTSFEAGLRGARPGAWRWNAGVFRSDNRDDLLFVADDAAGFGYFKNFGKTRRQGVELGADLQIGAGVTVGANYTWLDASFRSAEVVDGSSNSSNSEAVENGLPGVEGTIAVRPGDRIPGVPRQMLKLFADIAIGGQWSIGADLSAVDRSTARGNENGRHQPDGVYYLGNGYSPGYAVLNLNAEFRPAAGLTLFVQINNVFDRRYSTAAQLGATAFDDAGHFEAQPFPPNAEGDRPLRHATFYAPGAPRTVWAGLRAGF